MIDERRIKNFIFTNKFKMKKLSLIFIIFLLTSSFIFAQNKITFTIEDGQNFKNIIADEKVTVVNKRQLKRIKRKSTSWIRFHRKDFDINAYKKTKRFHTRFKKYSDMNLNKLPFKKDNEVVFINKEKNQIGIHAGKLVVSEKKEHHADYLSFVVVFNYEKNKIEELILKNTGYFLE